MRLWIAAFLLLIFACQALPVAALGKALAKSQLAAADDSGDDDGGTSIPGDGKIKKKSSFADDACIHLPGAASLLCSGQAARQIMLHRAEHLPVLYAGEVATPPPDFC